MIGDQHFIPLPGFAVGAPGSIEFFRFRWASYDGNKGISPRNSLPVNYRGERYSYELIVTSSDLIVQKNIRGNRMVLVQEGITEPETWVYWMVKWLKLHILVGLDTYRNQ
jgi:hypothetical protein